MKQLIDAIKQTLAKDGFDAENNRKGVISESMTSIGG